MNALRPLLGFLLLTACCAHRDASPASTPDDLATRSRALAHRLMIVDGHIDVPYRLQEQGALRGTPVEDVSQRTATGDFDHPRAVEGGLDVAFMSIYVPAELQKKPGESKALADALIDLVEKLARDAPTRFALARSPDEAERNRHAHLEGPEPAGPAGGGRDEPGGHHGGRGPRVR